MHSAGPASRAFFRISGATYAVIAVVLLCCGLVGLVYWLNRSAGAEQIVRAGLRAAGESVDAEGRAAALDRWERETAGDWQANPGALTDYIVARHDVRDSGVRALLTRVANVDYGDRMVDWQRWLDTRERLSRGKRPATPRGESVSLTRKWSAAVGLTAWFSTILAIDGRVFVASLGARFDDIEDADDGVVMVDGRTGEASYLFLPNDKPGARDVVGLAIEEDTVYAATRNGWLYALSVDGALQWKENVRSPIVGGPLLWNVNADKSADVILATAGGKLVAYSGASHKTLWTTSASETSGRNIDLGAMLAVGDVQGGGGPELIFTSPAGDVAVLAIESGERSFTGRLSAGAPGGPLAFGAAENRPAGVWIADGGATLWSIARLRRGVDLSRLLTVRSRTAGSMVSGPRPLLSPGESPSFFIVAQTGDYGGDQGSVAMLVDGQVYWRTPIGGSIWAAPAVADLTGDGLPEIIIASCETGADGVLSGMLTVLSSAGHILRRDRFDQPLESAPVVADVDGDQKLDLLVGDRGGTLHCFSTDRVGPVHWGVFGGDPWNTRNATHAYSFGQRASGMQRTWRP